MLNKLLRYDATTGKLFWKWRHPSVFDGCEIKTKSWNNRFAGKEALTALEAYGYKHGHILKIKLKAHRVVWAMLHGCWPVGEIDHINGNPADNRIGNLRDVSHSDNLKNRKISKNNTSGVVGVYWRKDRMKWRACIEANGVQMHLGTFDTRDEAVEARRKAQSKFGFHSNHGRPQNFTLA